MAAQQLLVEGAGHLGHEDRVVVIGVRLVPGRVVAVHRVARLVGQREDVVEHVGLVVHEDVRVAVVGAGAEGPALLAAVLVAVAPAAAAGRVPARRNTRCPAAASAASTSVDRLRPRCAAFCRLGQDRHVGVVVVDVLQPHLPPPHVVVVVQRGQVAMDRRDQVVVDRQRHVVGKQARPPGRSGSCGPGRSRCRADRAGQRRGQRVLMAGVLAVVLMEAALRTSACGECSKRAEGGVAQLEPARLVAHW